MNIIFYSIFESSTLENDVELYVYIYIIYISFFYKYLIYMSTISELSHWCELYISS